MNVLLDHNLPRRLRVYLSGHSIKTTREMGWEVLANGSLLKSACDAGFDAFLSLDKNIEYQQNLRTLPLPVVVVNAPSNALSALLPFVPYLLELLQSPLEPALYLIESSGSPLRIVSPRTRL